MFFLFKKFYLLKLNLKLIAIYEEYYSNLSELDNKQELHSQHSNTKIGNANIIDLNTINNNNKSNSLNNSSISTSSTSSTTTTTTTSSIQNFNNNNNTNFNTEDFIVNRNKINYCNKENTTNSNTLLKNEVFVTQKDFLTNHNINILNSGMKYSFYLNSNINNK